MVKTDFVLEAIAVVVTGLGIWHHAAYVVTVTKSLVVKSSKRLVEI
jgi:hypothetical protein